MAWTGATLSRRKVMWAVAEITWEDDGGTSFRVPAILEDTSRSGACIRVKRPVTIGSRLTIKWHREQFSGDSPELPQGWRRFLVRCATRGGHRLRREVSRPPGSSRRQSRKRCGKSRRSQTRELRHPPQTALPAPVRLPEPAHTAPRTSTARPVASAITSGVHGCC